MDRVGKTLSAVSPCLDENQARVQNGAPMPRERPAPGNRLKVLGSPSCFGCQSRERTEWAHLGEGDLAFLNTSKTCNVYDAGQVVFYEGNACLGIHCLESGSVVLRKSDGAGGSLVVGIAGAGSTLGYLAYFGHRGYTSTAEAIEPARVCFVDRAAVREMLQRNPSVGLRFLKRMADELETSEVKRVQALALPLRARAAHLLLVLKDRSSTVGDDGTLAVDLPLSRRDLAAMLGARPETLSRLIRDFELRGIAQFESRRVIVPDLDLLIDEVERARDGIG